MFRIRTREDCAITCRVRMVGIHFCVKSQRRRQPVQNIVYLSLGTNIGNRLSNLRFAISELKNFFDIQKTSHVIETEAMLLPDSPREWNTPFYNLVIAGETLLAPESLLQNVKEIEKKIGRSMDAPKWSPRKIDIDIISYKNLQIESPFLTIPHRGLAGRDFLQYSLVEAGYDDIPENIRIDLNAFSPINHFVLNPKFVGIVNITPDSFSDGGNFLSAENAEAQIRKLYGDGATLIDVGAQSTRPGYREISPSKEISRLSPALERCGDIDCISIDTYFDEVVRYAIKTHSIKWINDQNSRLNSDTIKLIADNDVKLITMLHGTDISWFYKRIETLRSYGMKPENIILDPGIGFGKSKRENISLIKNIAMLKDFGYEVLVGHSRKSFMQSFSNEEAKNRDIETIAISEFLLKSTVDYIRVHNVKDHMRFFVARHCIEIAT